jgi:hypothetical protein
LNLSSEKPVSKCAFKWVNLYRYKAAAAAAAAATAAASTATATTYAGAVPVGLYKFTHSLKAHGFNP